MGGSSGRHTRQWPRPRATDDGNEGDDGEADKGGNQESVEAADRLARRKPLALSVDGILLFFGLVVMWSDKLWLTFLICPPVYVYWMHGHLTRLRNGNLDGIRRPVYLVICDGLGATTLWATGPLCRWLEPTVWSIMFTVLLGSFGALLLVMPWLNANPLAEQVGSSQRTSLAATLALVMAFATLFPLAIHARNALSPHNPPELPSKILGYPEVQNKVIEEVLEPLWVGTGGGGLYGGGPSPYLFSVTAWTTRYPSTTIETDVPFGMLDGRSVKEGPLLCVRNWTGRTSIVYRYLPGIMAAVGQGILSGPLASIGDSSPQSRYFWGGTPTNGALRAPPNVACGLSYGNLTVLVILFGTDRSPALSQYSPLVFSQVLNEVFAYYRPQDSNLLSVVASDR